MKNLTALKAKAERARGTRTALAEKIGSSPAYITKILRGDTNFALDSMVKIPTALGCELTVGLNQLPPATRRQGKASHRGNAARPTSMLNDQPVS